MFAGDECEPKSRTSSCWALSRAQCQDGVLLKVYTILVGKAGFMIHTSQSEKLATLPWFSLTLYLYYITISL